MATRHTEKKFDNILDSIPHQDHSSDFPLADGYKVDIYIIWKLDGN